MGDSVSIPCLVRGFCFAIVAVSGTHMACFPNGCDCSVQDLKQNIHVCLRIIESVPTFLPRTASHNALLHGSKILILLYMKDSSRDFVHVFQFAIFFS